MRYKDVTNRLIATPALAVNTNTAFGTVSVAVVALRAYQRACCLCQVLCPINRKYWCCDWPISDVLVQHRVPPKGSVITAGSRLPTYTFSEIKFFSYKGFLDIEKSVLLELKGVKIIRSYRDLFQLIRDLFQMLFLYMYTC